MLATAGQFEAPEEMPLRPVILAVTVALASTIAAPAQEVDRVAETALRAFLGRCPGTLTLTSLPSAIAAPTGMTVNRVQVEGGSYWCDGSYYVIRTRDGKVWIGNPWPLEGRGSTADKIRNFAWNRLHQSFTARVDATPGRDGLVPVVLSQITEGGNIEIEGSVDATGTYFFMGRFHPFDSAKTNVRFDVLGDILASSPWKGAEQPAVTILEFSDFQCPACASAQPVIDSILADHAEKIRYVRADLPLVNAHPWAMSAAVIGRAIWKQSPEVYWQYKTRVYEEQASLNAFTIGAFARGIVEDAGLDLARFDQDLRDASTAEAVRRSMGAAFTAQLTGTPTYFVNGELVAFGPDGENLREAVARALGN